MSSDTKKTNCNIILGFTLVEVVMGMGLMTLLIAGVLQILQQSNYLTELARDRTQASQFIQDELERVRLLNWNDLGKLKDWEQVIPDTNFSAYYGNKFYLYREIKTTPDVHKDVTVIVEWKDSKDSTQKSFSSTRISNGGINEYYNSSI